MIDSMKTAARKIKRVMRATIDNRLVDYHIPRGWPGDLLLTFDDGPHVENTPKILDLLDQFHARAIFFVIGVRAEKHPEVMRECIDRGHIVANHSFTHLNDTAGGRYTRRRVVDEIEKCNALVTRETGQVTYLFRPPRGELNLKTYGATKDTNHRMMLWSLDGGEWGQRSHWSAEDISGFVTQNVKKRDMVLLHDDNEKSLVVLSDLLKLVDQRGYDMASAVTLGAKAPYSA